jgi:hypothetical protein
MAIPLITTQLDSVDANAGNQTNFSETVSVGGSTSSVFASPGSEAPGASTTPATAADASQADSAQNWGFYLLVAAMLYLAVRWSGG